MAERPDNSSSPNADGLGVDILKKYQNMITALFSFIKVGNRDDQVAHQGMLRCVMKSAPNLVAAMSLFERSDVSILFASEDEVIDFFVTYFHEAQNVSEKKKSLPERLIEFAKLPEKVQGRLFKSVHSLLQEYAQSDEVLTEEYTSVLVKLLILIKTLGFDQLIRILMQFSVSLPHQNVLLRILDDKPFAKVWLEIPFEEKVNICESWATTRVMNLNGGSQPGGSGKAVAVYESIDAIMRCSLNDSIAEILARRVSDSVVKRSLEKSDFFGVLQAFGAIEKCSPVVQKCYISHVGKMLTPERIKKSSKFLENLSSSNLGRELLFCILDIIRAPEVAEKVLTDEKAFMNILDWCDVWIILFKTNGMLEKSKKYRAGKLICQHLAEHIRVGNVSLELLEVLHNNKKKVSLLCSNISSNHDLGQSLNEKISELNRVVEDCPQKFQLLEAAINYGKAVSGETFQFQSETFIEALNVLKKTWRTKKVRELQHEQFWGLLLPLLGPAKSLHDDFQAQWKSFRHYPGLLRVETVSTLLDTLKSENRLIEGQQLLEKYFNRKFSPSIKMYIDDCVNLPNVLNTFLCVVDVLEAFGLTDPSVKEYLQFQKTLKNRKTLTLAELHEIMEKIKPTILLFSGNNVDSVLQELARSKELINFMEQIVEEDVRFLIDAVEEHSNVTMSLVSDFIIVHSFLARLIRMRNEKKIFYLEDFLKTLTSRIDEDIAGKIKQCSINVNNIRSFYKSIANRGEMTKEIIRNCLSRGEYWVSQEDGKCEIKMRYVTVESDNEKICFFSLLDLNDLQSRADLIRASCANTKVPFSYSSKSEEDIDFDDFINQINLLTEISILLSKLLSSGFAKYRTYIKILKTTDDLQTSRDELQIVLKNLENLLKESRDKFHFLNYYCSDQLCRLYYYLINESDVNCDDILSLIHYVDRTITKQELGQQRQSQKPEKSGSNDSPDILLSTVGQALEKIFSNSKQVIRFISDDKGSLWYSKLEALVTPGEIFVASLEPESPLTANVILTLYENTSKAFPEPYQIVFCSTETTWEEIHLLLQRCFERSKDVHRRNLFCIANVELLPNELQFTLVNAIKNRQKCYQSSEAMNENPDYLLALICRGGDHHHIVEQFAQFSHNIAGMSDNALSDRLRSCWPEVKMITSTLPGLGKTERIRREIQEKKMNAATFSISGPFEPSKLIERLKKLKLRKYHCLHLDIGEVSDPLLLDTFLFQLIVTGMVSAGMQFYHLPTTHIYIEIANTLKDWLLESLVVSKYFTRIRLEWQNYKNLLVSPEITSNIQVVCQYLDIFDRTCMELEEVQFSGATKSKPLSARRCQDLLAKYYSSDADITFTTLHRFLGVLASQLSKFSESAFFKIANLKSMMGDKGHSVRSNLFGALLKVSKEFASRAINTCRSSDKKNLSQEESAKAFDEAMVSTATSAKDMVDWVTGMIKWKEWNDFFVVFHGLNSQAITAMYWNRSLVPEGVEMLLKSQGVGENEELEDFNCFTQEQLQKKLEKIACSKPVERSNLFQGYRYALTPDNILKMILIILRVRANIPIIIMGETGCGKTSLVRYLAKTCGVQFHTFNFHAGISEKDIVAFISMINERNEEMWILLDEINTCDHLGLINDIMCHHSLCGRRLSKNLVFLAACNPYKLRPQEHIRAAGLEGKNITDEYSGLVYPVHPLPEAMIDYVWDYGALSPEDERNYIKRMVRDLPKKYEGMLVDLLAVSQNLIRNVEKNHFCVSLRDVNRCIHLISWFNNMLKTRQELKENKVEYPSHLQQYHSISQQYKNDPTTKSIVLALAHCYLSRLPTAELRRDYRESMMYIFSNNKIQMTYDANVDTFTAIVRMEEEDYLERMDLPPGTARNAALRENMFVMLVCILNRIPIFVVGKPGCSKSLSIQLIRSNLRGRDSRDPLFRQLPQLYVVSYQGSESSTSEGIMKVFEKARKYKDYNKDGNVLPVVLLDEVGLAENSKYNPLKVLHSLLEPGEGKLPDVAIVGISDWSLDAAKMNRAIHLSRPELNKEDLYEIGHSLHYADEGDDSQHLRVEELRCLAEAYFEYQAQQRHANFHGLRDYYSLIKSLTGSSSFQQVNISLQRNFGGLPGEVTNIQKIFLDKLKTFMVSSGQDIIPITQLIQENLSDPYARHLMLITNGDLALGILKQSLAQLEKETITIFGSRFEEDLSEEYSYRILSRVILCMERDCILILKDLESIYGSLYDMLNQNYTVVGNRKDCRVALGAYSNPMCQVNDGFRCIVLVDQHKVNYSDPPFLNRFEKQLLRFSDVLTEDQKGVINELNRWVGGISTVEGLQSHFHVSDVFIGFHEDTLPSLVLSHSHDADSSTDVLKKCKDDLMWVASPDGVLRMQKCNFLKEDSSEVQDLSDEYFRKPLHHGFPAFFEHVVANHQESSFFASDEIGSKTIVMTFANIHTDIRQCLGNGVRCQVERLSAYKSEKQLAERISQFWNASEKELLVLQCKPDLDGTHLLLARSIIEEKRDAYKQWLHETESKAQGFKHVCIVVHVQRGEENANSIRWQFSFLCGWRQVFLDVLEAPLVPLNEILGESVQKLLTSSIWPIRRIAQNDLLWCFTCIKYTRWQRPLDTVLRIAKSLFYSDTVSEVIEKLILESINLNTHEKDQDIYFRDSWQVKVACDRQSLVNSSTLYCAMEQFVSRLVRNPLAKIVYFLEKENAWPPHLCNDLDETLLLKLEDMWRNFILDSAVFNMSDIPEPHGAETYILESISLDLLLPFSQLVSKKVDSVKELFLEDCSQLVENKDNLDENGELNQSVRQQQLERFAKMITDQVPELDSITTHFHILYMTDIFDMMTADFRLTLPRSQRVALVQAVFTSEVKQGFPAKDMPEFFALLHTFAWVHREEILDMLKMIDHCRLFIELSVLLKITDDILGSSKEVMLAEIDETESNPQVDSQTETLNENLETAENTESDGELESNEDPSEQSEAKLADIDLEFEKPSSENEDNEEEVIEEIMDDPGDSTEKIGDVLVTLYCEMMFPSPEVVEKSGSPELWMRNANLLLSLALKISEHSPAFHYLRLCVDFLRINFISDELPLCTLSEIATTLSPEYLDHEDSFETITEQLIRPLEEEMKGNRHKREALQKFSALFYGRCIDTNVDTCGVSPIVKEVLSLERPELVLKMSPVVLRLLMVEQMQSPGIFKNLIDNPSVMDNCPCLQNIDEVFSDLFSNGLIHHDSYPSVMTCDLIESQLDFKNDFGISDLNSSDCEVLVLAKSAVNVIAQNGEDACGIRVFSSVAFLRGFFTMLAQFIAANPGVIDKGSPYVPVITEVNSLLKDAKSTLPTFFLKQLRENAGIFDLQKWFGENSVLSSIEELWANEKYEDKSVFTTVLKHPEYEEAKAAYWKIISDDKPSMQAFLTKCRGSPKHAFALLGILINMVYLKRSVRKLTDKEEQFVNWFAENVSPFPKLFQELLLRIIGRQDFHCPELQLSSESSVDDVEFALLVLHIACVVATGALNENLPFYRYVTNPAKFKQPLVLAHREEELHSIFKYKPYLMDSVLATCQCGVRLAFNGEIDEAKCPRCQETLGDETESGTSATLPLSFHCGASLESDLCAKHMCPAVYRALHLVVYSSYYAGVALGTSNKDNLSSVLNVLNVFGPDSDPVKTCVKTIRDDLSHLMKILSCKRDVAIKTMHVVLEKSSDLITSNNMLGANDCSTQEGRREWEVEFSHLTEPVFSKLREAPEQMQVPMKLQQTKDNQENVSVECRILELDNYPNEPTEQNQQLKRLFRATKQPCFEDFRSAFLHSPKEIQSNHSFLALFFAKFEQLPIIGHLHHLLKWSRLVSSALTHRISRKDAESKSINDFISGHLLELERSPQELESLRLLFDSFKEAWNETRPLVNQALAEKELDKMPWLVETDCIAYCLMESDFGVYLKEAIGILVSYQNSILDIILSLSSSHLQPALSVFEEDHGSSIACVTIQEVKEKEIICFQWSDADLLRYGQSNLEYGKGRKITYDFERIEMWLASKIVFGKCFLTGALTRFIFAKELFHSCGQLLTEIRKLVKQNPILPEEVCKGLAILKERRIKEAQDLLQHIEVLIFLLKRKLKTFNVDMTLEELAEEWTSMLPSPFPVSLLPEPRSSIKIKHVAALYEALEDLLADGAIDGLADQFRYQLPIKMKEAICAVLAKDVLALKPPNFLKALRRFVFRYLSSETERYWPEERKSLQSCLDEPSLWSPLPLPNLDEIPREITLENIHSTVKYIEEVEKEKKASISRRPGLRSSPRPPQKIKQPGKSARRRVANFN